MQRLYSGFLFVFIGDFLYKIMQNHSTKMIKTNGQCEGCLYKGKVTAELYCLIILKNV